MGLVMDINSTARWGRLTFVMVPVRSGNNGSRDNAQTATCGPMELTMTNLVKRFMKDETGATAIEYGLIAAGISVAIIAVVQGLGSKLNTTFTSVQTALK
jgi:pilus assembly protein Flp/PilA